MAIKHAGHWQRCATCRDARAGARSETRTDENQSAAAEARANAQARRCSLARLRHVLTVCCSQHDLVDDNNADNEPDDAQPRLIARAQPGQYRNPDKVAPMADKQSLGYYGAAQINGPQSTKEFLALFEAVRRPAATRIFSREPQRDEKFAKAWNHLDKVRLFYVILQRDGRRAAVKKIHHGDR